MSKGFVDEGDGFEQEPGGEKQGEKRGGGSRDNGEDRDIARRMEEAHRCVWDATY